MTTVRLPRWAKPVAKAALVVVLPTPPLPEVTTITCAMALFPLCEFLSPLPRALGPP